MSSIRALLVDDEAPARQRLSLMLADHADVSVVGEAATVAEALPLLTSLQPTCVFLDVHMPGADGFRLLDAVPASETPLVVFVTAHEGHARRAFDVNAVDYLLKPYDDERLAQALDKVRRAAPPLSAAPPAKQTAHDLYPDRFAVTVGRTTQFVAAHEVLWVQADRNYVWLHTAAQSFLVRSGIGAMEAQFDPALFVRVHRSALVRYTAVKEVRSKPNGDADALLVNGQKVPVSARHRARLLGRS